MTNKGRLPTLGTDDPVISEIAWFINTIYQPAQAKYSRLSKLTRTLSAVSILLALVFLSYFALSVLFPELKLFATSLIYDGYEYNLAIFPSLMLFLAAIILSLRIQIVEKSWRKTVLNSMPLVQASAFLLLLMFCFNQAVVAAAGLLNLVSFLVTYMVNRLFGYTSAATRNQTMIYNLKRLKREYEIASVGCDGYELEILQEATFKALFQLEKDNVKRLDKEIMGDHYTVHDSAFNALKGLRKP
ncbi:hypothetical protein [Pseudoalteromonas sp. NC201]|uniref:hypothetical protein n=1 Tax=Pseudoalteromonas sp. NC201 TaxID=1514074 RepID=UPI000C7DB939|nr:hypothetical protein [Pseudoalteromonas sp. NC201]AUJ69179.1 hypothetical protein PNC201_04295 [Pseudoalteromonas sp. NC201]